MKDVFMTAEHNYGVAQCDGVNRDVNWDNSLLTHSLTHSLTLTYLLTYLYNSVVDCLMERAQLTGDHRPSAVSRAALAGAGEGRTCKGLQMSGKVLKIFF